MDLVVFLPNVYVEEKDKANNRKLLKNEEKNVLKLELSFSPQGGLTASIEYTLRPWAKLL